MNLAVQLHYRHLIIVVCMYRGGELAEELTRHGITVRYLEKCSRWDIQRPLRKLLRFIRSDRPDIVHSYGPVPNLIAALFKASFGGARVVWGIRIGKIDLSPYGKLAKRVSWAEGKFSRFTDLIISNSIDGKNAAIAKGCPAHKLVVIPNGIDLERFRFDKECRSRVRHEWGVKESQIVISIIGRIDPQKDHRNFIKALKNLSRKNNQSIVALSIGGRSHEQILPLIQEVKCLGLESIFRWQLESSNIAKYLNGVDILVSASTSEGVSNVILEALATGVPCVVTDVGDSARIVGESGVVVPPRDAVALAQGIEKMIQQLTKRKVDRGSLRRRIYDEYSLQKLLSRTEQTLSALLDTQRT